MLQNCSAQLRSQNLCKQMLRTQQKIIETRHLSDIGTQSSVGAQNNQKVRDKKNGNCLAEVAIELLVGVTGFEPATTRPPDVYANRTALHPDLRERKYRQMLKKIAFQPKNLEQKGKTKAHQNKAGDAVEPKHTGPTQPRPEAAGQV